MMLDATTYGGREANLSLTGRQSHSPLFYWTRCAFFSRTTKPTVTNITRNTNILPSVTNKVKSGNAKGLRGGRNGAPNKMIPTNNKINAEKVSMNCGDMFLQYDQWDLTIYFQVNR